MQEMMRYEKELLNAIVARIKIISGMNISEKRAPQDGRCLLYTSNIMVVRNWIASSYMKKLIRLYIM